MLILIIGCVAFGYFMSSICRLLTWDDYCKQVAASASTGGAMYMADQQMQEQFHQQNELFQQEQFRQQNDQFMQESMKFGMDSVTPMEHGGMNMDFGNSFNDIGAGGLFDFGGDSLFDCGGGLFDCGGGFFDGGFGGFGGCGF